MAYIGQTRPQAAIASSSITPENLTFPFTGRNLLINGDMSIWQRGGTLLSQTTTQINYGPDRWCTYSNGNLIDIVRGSSDTGSQYSCRVQRQSGQTSTTAVELIQVLESTNSIPLQGKEITLSVKVKAGANFSGSNLSVQLYAGTDTDGSSANMRSGSWSNSTTPISDTAAITTSYQTFTFTGTVPTNTTQLGVYFYYVPTGTAGADDAFYVDNVQLEEGSEFTDFERVNNATQLMRCQRYYCSGLALQGNGGTMIMHGYYGGSGAYQYLDGYIDSMRTTPTVSLLNNTGIRGYTSSAWSSVTLNISVIGNTENAMTIRLHTSGLFFTEPGMGRLLDKQSANDVRWVADAEL